MTEKPVFNGPAVAGRILETAWLITIFVIPLYFNPTGSQAFYFAKSILLMFLVTIMTGLAAAKWLLEKQELRPSNLVRWLKHSPLPVATLVFGLLYALSTVLSIQPYTSLWGNLADKNGLVSIVAWIIFFLILAQNVNSRAQVNRIVYALIASAGLMALIGILQHFSPAVLPWFKYSGRVFSTAGNPLSLSAFIAMCLPITLALIMIRWHEIPAGRNRLSPDLIGPVLSFLLQVACLWFAQYSITWVMYILGIIVFVFACGLFLKNRIALITGAVLIALIIMLAGVLLGQLVDQKAAGTGGEVQVSGTTYAREMGLNTLALRPQMWKSAVQVVLDSPEVPYSEDRFHSIRPVIGYGPDTFIITSQLRYPSELKSSDTYQSLLLSQPENYYLFLAATVGILGLFAYLAIIVTAIYCGVRIIRANADRSLLLLLAAFAGALAQYCAHILLSPANIVPDLVFWLMLGLTAAFYRMKLYTQKDELPAGIAVRPAGVGKVRKAVAAAIILIAVIIAFGLTAQPFLADIKLQQAFNTWERDRNSALGMFTQAARLDRYEATYYGFLGYYSYQLAISTGNEAEKTALLNVSLAAYDAADRLEPYLAYWHYMPADVNAYWAANGAEEKWKEAFYLYENADAFFPGNAVILNKWAISLIVFGDYDEAATKLQKSRQNDPDWGQTAYIEGYLQAERGDIKGAGSKLVRQAEQQPDSIRYFLSMCRQLAQYGKLDNLRSCLGSNLRDSGGQWQGYTLLGIGDFYSGNLSASAESLLKSAGLAPGAQRKMLMDLTTFLTIEDPHFSDYARQILTVLKGTSP